MPSANLQWRFHSGKRVVARRPLVLYREDGVNSLLIYSFWRHFSLLSKLSKCVPYRFPLGAVFLIE